MRINGSGGLPSCAPARRSSTSRPVSCGMSTSITSTCTGGSASASTASASSPVAASSTSAPSPSSTIRSVRRMLRSSSATRIRPCNASDSTGATPSLIDRLQSCPRLPASGSDAAHTHEGGDGVDVHRRLLAALEVLERELALRELVLAEDAAPRHFHTGAVGVLHLL